MLDKRRQLIRTYQIVGAVVLLAILTSAAIVARGWMADIPEFMRLIPGQTPTQGATAVSIMIAVLALVLALFPGPPAWAVWLSRGLAVALIAVATVTFVEDVSGRDYGLDFSLWDLPTGEKGLTFPGPMAPNISVNVLLLGLSLLLYDLKVKQSYPGQLAAAGCALLSIMALIGYACGAAFLCTMFGCIRMSMATSLLFLGMCFALLVSKPDRGLTEIFCASTLGGSIARRFACMIFSVPVLLWLRYLGEQSGLYDSAFGWGLFGIATIIVAGLCIGFNATAADTMDTARTTAEQKLERSSQQISELISSQLLSQSGNVRDRQRLKYVCLTCSKEFDSEVIACPDDGTEITSLAQDLLIGTIFAERYHVLEMLGSGGMSTVYKARHVLLNKLVAIKLMHTHLVNEMVNVRRFQHEAKTASMLTHPNLVGVHDFGVSASGEPFLVMDYVEGMSLGDLLDKVRRLDVDRALDIFIQVLDGMAYAHDHNIIHRDLKPGNIMLLYAEDGSEQVKVVDFGLAKLLGQDKNQKLTKTGEVFGSPMYMSPEQVLGDDLNGLSDIYAIGCVMYECLSGEPPIKGETVMETITLHMERMPAPLPPELRIPKELEALVLKSLEKRPDLRPQSAAELSTLLKNLKSTLYNARKR